MCISPIRIRNPNAGMSGMKSTLMKDTSSMFINVPCGVCPECIAVRQMNFVQRIQCESMVNHLFFITLTYNNECLPVCSVSTGYDIRYADVSDVQKMFKRLRSSKAIPRSFRYFGVSELGSAKGRPHFHILLVVPKEKTDSYADCLHLESVISKAVLHEWRRNYGSDRMPDYKPLCSYVRKMVRGKIRTNFDCHYVNPVLSQGQEADVAFYVLKYMMKPSDRVRRLQQALHLNLDVDEYESVWKIVRPRHFESEAFGLGQCVKDNCGKYVIHPDVLKYLRSCVQSSKLTEDSPKFYSPVTGKSFPLAKYYKKFSEIFSYDDALDFYYNDTKGRVDNVIIPDDVHVSQLLKKVDDFNDKLNRVESYDSAQNLNELFDENLDC